MNQEIKHTPEPWFVDEFGMYVYGESVGGAGMRLSNHMVCEMRGFGHLKYHGEDHAITVQRLNQQRIVACVNVLAGVKDPDAAVVDIVAAVRAFLDQIDHGYIQDIGEHATRRLRLAAAQFPEKVGA